MLRLWLRYPNARPLPDGFVGGYVTDIRRDIAKQIGIAD